MPKPTTARGLFVVLEGIEGAGKSTQLAVAAQALEQGGHTVHRTREPGGTPLAEAIRGVLLDDWQEDVPATTELLLMFGARTAHIANKIWPAIAAGEHVISDRFTDASYAYQGAGRGLPTDYVAQLETLVQGEFQPDLVLVLDLPVEDALKRVASRGGENRFDREAADFFARTRQVYLDRAAAAPQRYAVIDASQSIDAVSTDVRAAIAQLLARSGDQTRA